MQLENAVILPRLVPEVLDGFMMEPIYVLCNDMRDDGRVLERSESIVRGVGLCVANGRVAQVRAQPSKEVKNEPAASLTIVVLTSSVA